MGIMRRMGFGMVALTLGLSSAVIAVPANAMAVEGGGEAPVVQQTVRYTDAQLAQRVNPVVHEYRQDDGNQAWRVTPSTRLIIDRSAHDDSRLAQTVKLVNAELVSKGVVPQSLSMTYGEESATGAADVFVSVDASVDLPGRTSDEYVISVGADGVRIRAVSDVAAMYALRTIEAMMITTGSMPLGQIKDYSDIAERRLFLDCGRKYFTADWIKRQIRELSYLKFNTLELHFSENFGFRLQSELHPEIVSTDGALTKDEMRGILREARLYGVKVIPSIDSPGHTDWILRSHPEFGQVDIDGNHYKSGIDVTNPQAVEFMKSIYTEYADLFAEFPDVCTDFQIGGDEYMEFDRPPFTTKYMPVLNAYAEQTLGEGYDWRDVLTAYINDIAKLVESKGFKPRMYNDGMYYGETGTSVSTQGAQKLNFDPNIGVDYWSNMPWNESIATLKTILDRGHKDLYNVNSSFGYYVLRNPDSTHPDGWAAFDNDDPDKLIFEQWRPGAFSGNTDTIADDDARIKGAGMHIWCDNAKIATEDQVASDIAMPLRAMATRLWNVASNQGFTFADFQAMTDTLGHVAGYEDGVLPAVGDIEDPSATQTEPTPEAKDPLAPTGASMYGAIFGAMILAAAGLAMMAKRHRVR